MRRILFVVILALLVTACGAKGALYLPDKKYPQPGDRDQSQDQGQNEDQGDTQSQNNSQSQDTNTK
jgi:predicted small lipoprotein YifL